MLFATDKIIKNILFIFFIILSFIFIPYLHDLHAQEVGATQNAKNDKKNIFVFVRDTCAHCKAEKAFLNNDDYIKQNANVIYLNLVEQENKLKWKDIAKKYETGLVTPITLVGGKVIAGFDERRTPVEIKRLLKNSINYDYEFYKTHNAKTSNKGGATCSDEETQSCTIDGETMNLPYFGDVSPKETSLLLISSVLGFIDGFNPCAMWVLLTFLLVLSQTGSRKKMAQMVGLFLFAEAVMYYLILNVWYKTWDFVALDNIVTPAVGALALGSGLFFLFRYVKERNKPLTCDVTSIEHQKKIGDKIQALAGRPMTLAVAGAVLLLAFSVNVIEFACSIGIPQAYTKVLEINNLSFLMQQLYTLVYTFFYMADDIVVFALALWGYSKFYAWGAKYSRISTLIAGILMLILGMLMLFAPELLVL